MTDQMQQVIDEIMKAFKFVKTQRVMEFLNWTWGLENPFIPTVSDLRQTARRLLTEAANGDVGHDHQTGGFRAFKTMSTEEGNEGMHLDLEFTLESYSYNEEWLKDEVGVKSTGGVYEK